jgi:hypothetical protein
MQMRGACLGRLANQSFRAGRRSRSLHFRTVYVGGRRPGDSSHSLMCEPVSATRALLIARSRSRPGGSSVACSRSRRASAARRSSRDVVCLMRRRSCMALAPVQTEGRRRRDGVLFIAVIGFVNTCGRPNLSKSNHSSRSSLRKSSMSRVC